MAYTPLKTAIWSGAEGTWGTAATIDTKLGTIKSFVGNQSWEVMEIAGCGDGREVQNHLRTRFNVRPVVTFEVHNFDFLRHAIGPRAGAGTTASKYTITEADTYGVTAISDIIPMTIEVAGDDATDDVDKYRGCFIDEFELSGNLGGVLTATINCIGKDILSSTTATAYTPLTTYPYTMTGEGTFKYDTTPTAISGMRSFSIRMKNNSIVYGDWNTVFIIQPLTGERRYTFSTTVVMSSTMATQIRDKFYGQANSPIDDEPEFAADAELHAIFSQGSSSGDRNAEIKLDQCIIENISKPINYGSGDAVLLTFSGRAKTALSNVFVTYWTTT